MNKKLVKLVSVILMVIMLCSIALNVFAEGEMITPSSIQGTSGTANVAGISNIGNNVVRILQTIGIVLSVVMIIVIGIKYMMGSPDEKAEYKKTMMPYLVGALLIFSASALAQFIYTMFNNWSISGK